MMSSFGRNKTSSENAGDKLQLRLGEKEDPDSSTIARSVFISYVLGEKIIT